MPKITEKEIEHIAELARIRLTDEEKHKFTEDLGNILNFVDKLKEIDTKDVEPVSNMTGLDSVFRKDEVHGEVDSEKSKRLVEQAPDSKDDYVKVKSVFED
jgi:aspartyl-tRNA(Asn)/glutamyl-tRNA(Gln) amidotransferase subunit C